MGATFSRLKNWVAEALTYADLNAEIDNILTNLTPSGVDDMSSNAAAMRVNTSPGTAGSESLATSLAGEIERLRFVILRMIGSSATYWYDAPTATLTNVATILSTSVANRITSGRVRGASSANSQPIFLQPQGTAASVILNATATTLQYYVNNSVYNITSNVTLGSLSTAPATNNTCAVNMPGLAGQDWSKLVGEYGTTLPIDNIGTEITGLVGKIAAFKTGNEYFIAKVESARLSQIQRGFFFDNADAPIARVGISDNDGITLMKLGWIYANTAGGLEVGYTNPSIGSQPSSAVTDDYWYDTANNTWKKFTSSTWGASNSHLIGLSVQNTSGCMAARSFDFSKSFLPTNGIRIKIGSNSTVVSHGILNGINVYGTPLNFFPLSLTWDMASDLDSGVTEAASTMYYMYIKETGKTVISDVAPYDRTGDLLGLYHPHSAWRCVGQAYNDATSNLVACIDYSDMSSDNFRVTTQISGGALTIDIHGNPLVKHKLPAQNAADINYPILSKQGITIPSTATMGHSSGNGHPIHVAALDGDGAIFPAVSTYYQKQSSSVTSAAIGTGSDANSVLYALGARTAVSVVPVAYMMGTMATAGVWSTAVVDIKKWPYKPIPITSRYTIGTPHTLAATTTTSLVYTTRFDDSHNCMTTGAFVAPKNMKASVQARATWNDGTAAWTASNFYDLQIFRQGTSYALNHNIVVANDTYQKPMVVTDSINLSVGDVVAIYAAHGETGQNRVLLGGTNATFTVMEIGEDT